MCNISKLLNNWQFLLSSNYLTHRSGRKLTICWVVSGPEEHLHQWQNSSTVKAGSQNLILRQNFVSLGGKRKCDWVLKAYSCLCPCCLPDGCSRTESKPKLTFWRVCRTEANSFCITLLESMQVLEEARNQLVNNLGAVKRKTMLSRKLWIDTVFWSSVTGWAS